MNQTANKSLDLNQSLGMRIRQRRSELRLRLFELAEMCDISVSFLSQIERDQANPSISTLHDIAIALGVTVASFFASLADELPQLSSELKKEPAAHVVRANARKTLLYPGSGIRNELLSPDLNRDIQMMRVIIPPGADTGDEPLVHEGEECGLVLQGTVEIWVEEELYILGPGDTIYQKSTIPHRSRNIGDIDVIIVVAITPPSF
ncbi:MAG: cupin domain-containing protein [Anaerolineaceae bacterium]|nr:cupin domain-containing protein [Anaerolineaceae bacterium]